MPIRPPFMVSYSITTKCNLKCKHCYSESVDQAASDELSTKEAFRLIDDLSDWGIGLLIVDGGEPLCREDLLNVVKYASAKGIRTTIGSNGTLIDETRARKLLDAGVMSVAISIDGANAQTHDSFRGVSGSFEQALKGVEACRNAGLPFQFNMVIRKQTLSQVEDMLRLAVESRANAAEFFDLVAAGRAKQECKDDVLSNNERKQIMEWLAQAQEDCPIVIRVPGCPMYPLLLQQKHIQPRRFPVQMLQRIPYYGRGCAAGMPMGYVMVLSNGEVNPCMLLQVKLGDIRRQSIISIWENSTVLTKLRQRELLKGKCRDCSYKGPCSGCRGRAYEETGDMMAPDLGCWLALESGAQNERQHERLELGKQ
jgi:radical SAM protein with 4Fe4S-binding SPASM domain